MRTRHLDKSVTEGGRTAWFPFDLDCLAVVVRKRSHQKASTEEVT